MFVESHSKMFHKYGDVTIIGDRLQMLSHARHLWPLSCEGSLGCHTCCGMGHLSIMTRDTHTYYRVFGTGAATTYFKDMAVAGGI